MSADIEKSLWFFKEVVGLEETREVDGALAQIACEVGSIYVEGN